ncbi:TPA: hypothetical protein N0F65_003259 [Lagenidium giganteum]|uniref:DDE Tnp4 domain-containing protein n=1 Tax=Lagenidium giganteum TaxID=4803 RepID=A0AAV2YK09_9STRA|nr:TPA: hypothetical protein N0F65_003259 [Lagenidium giganteum]
MVLTHIYDHFKHLLSFDQHGYDDHKLREFAGAIHARGAALRECVGFIDGTVRGICRPTKMQKYNFNGHKRKHALKYQSVVTPNGIISHLHGPIPGARRDAYLLSVSSLYDEAHDLLQDDGKQFILYGDPAYGRQDYILAPFKGAILTSEQEEFNSSMSEVRVCVESTAAVLGVL